MTAYRPVMRQTRATGSSVRWRLESALSNALYRVIGMSRRIRILPNMFRKMLRRQADSKFLVHSGQFDADWYLACNPDIAKAGANPLMHYINYGAAEGRDPHPLFDTDWYLANNPDVAQ